MPSGFWSYRTAHASLMSRNSNSGHWWMEEGCHIEFIPSRKIFMPNVQPHHVVKLSNTFFSIVVDKTWSAWKGCRGWIFFPALVTKDLCWCHFNDPVIKIPSFWIYDTYHREIKNDILIFFYSIVVDKNTPKAMSLWSTALIVSVWGTLPMMITDFVFYLLSTIAHLG